MTQAGAASDAMPPADAAPGAMPRADAAPDVMQRSGAAPDAMPRADAAPCATAQAQTSQRLFAVIGAGWAGLAAALALQDQGHSVHLYEAARTPGGRARRVDGEPPMGPLDNGQHILLGAYTATLDLMRTLGCDPDALFHRERLALRMADDSFSLRAAPLPAPLHMAAGLLGARGLTLRERTALARQITRLRLRRWIIAGSPQRDPHTNDAAQSMPGGSMGEARAPREATGDARDERGDMSVAQWLRLGGQSARIIELFWRPLCVAALNTPPEEASAQLLANVLRDSLGGSARDCDVLIPRTDLSSLWPDRAIQALAAHSGSAVLLGEAVRTLSLGEIARTPMSGSAARTSPPSEIAHMQSSGESATSLPQNEYDPAEMRGQARAYVNGRPYDGVIIATNAPSARRLLAQLPESPGGAALLAALDAFEFIPIATLSLRLERPWRLPAPMLMLREDPSRLAFGQWLFDHSALQGSTGQQASTLAHIVVSDARAMQEQDADAAIHGMIAQIKDQAGRRAPMPGVVAHRLIMEKRATFKASPGLARPASVTPWPAIWLAGDWTDTGYPGVLEGAVRSGMAAATAANPQDSGNSA